MPKKQQNPAEDSRIMIAQCRQRITTALSALVGAESSFAFIYDLYQLGELYKKSRDESNHSKQWIKIRNWLPGALMMPNSPIVYMRFFLQPAIKIEIEGLLKNTGQGAAVLLEKLKVRKNDLLMPSMVAVFKSYVEQITQDCNLADVNAYNALAMKVIVMAKMAKKHFIDFFKQYALDTDIYILRILIEMRQGFSHYYITQYGEERRLEVVINLKNELVDAIKEGFGELEKAFVGALAVKEQEQKTAIKMKEVAVTPPKKTSTPSPIGTPLIPAVLLKKATSQNKTPVKGALASPFPAKPSSPASPKRKHAELESAQKTGSPKKLKIALYEGLPSPKKKSSFEKQSSPKKMNSPKKILFQEGMVENELAKSEQGSSFSSGIISSTLFLPRSPKKLIFDDNENSKDNSPNSKKEISAKHSPIVASSIVSEGRNFKAARRLFADETLPEVSSHHGNSFWEPAVNNAKPNDKKNCANDTILFVENSFS